MQIKQLKKYPQKTINVIEASFRYLAIKIIKKKKPATAGLFLTSFHIIENGEKFFGLSKIDWIFDNTNLVLCNHSMFKHWFTLYPKKTDYVFYNLSLNQNLGLQFFKMWRKRCNIKFGFVTLSQISP